MSAPGRSPALIPEHTRAEVSPANPTRLDRWLIALALTAALAGAASEVQAAEAPAAEQPAPAWSWDGIYKADLLHGRRIDSGIGNLGLRVNADAGALFGWDDTTLHGELLWNHGGKPNRRIGTTQGVSNLEVAENAARVYASWIEHEFKATDTSVLFGLYDLNSEFYATDASGLLIHPSFGIGIDFSQSGRNGPSIFPNLGLALRVKQQLGSGYYLQGAVLDGVPGDPDHPGRTTIKLSKDDGALLVSEVGWQQRADDGSAQSGHWAIGAWRYTARSDRLDGSGSERNQGAYALVQQLLIDGDTARTTGFLRAGVANRRVNAVDVAFDTGVLIDKPFGESGPSALTAGLAVARYGTAHRQAQADAGAAIATHETAFEIGARWQPAPSLAVQPLLQRVWNPGGRSGTRETLVGLRIEWSFGAPKP